MGSAKYVRARGTRRTVGLALRLNGRSGTFRAPAEATVQPGARDAFAQLALMTRLTNTVGEPHQLFSSQQDCEQRLPARAGQAVAVAEVLEDALVASAAQGQPLPAWLCGRLASLYRTLGRYDDEVHLLERFRDSQGSEEARTRYDARLSKARTIAERRRRRESGALESVRVSMGGVPARRPLRPRAGQRVAAFAPEATAAIERAFCSRSRADKGVDEALALLCAEAHANDIPADALVAELRRAWGAARPGRKTPARDPRYDRALLVLLALYYKEQQT